MDGMLLGNILLRNARDPGLNGKTAIIFGNRALTYGELNEKSNRVANGLLERGVRKGDRIGVLSRNSDAYVAVYFALAKLGAIMVPVNFWYRSREIRYTLRQSAARGLIYQNRFADVVAGVGDLHGLEWTLTVGDSHGNRLEDVAAGSPSGEPGVELDENDPHIILYTSGTTGFPKGAVFSHKSHYLQALSLAMSTGGNGDDVGLVVYPLFHTGGPDCLVLPHFLTGATLVILDGADPGAILSATALHRATNIFCVPTVWRWILAHQQRRKVDVTSVRRCLGSSDTFPKALLEEIMATFESDVYVTYGLTEAGCILTVCRLTANDLRKLGSVGRPMPSVELNVLDPSGDPVPSRGSGRGCREDGVCNARILEHAGKNSGGAERRLAAHGRSGQGRRRRLSLPVRPVEGYDHQRRGEYLSAGNRTPVERTPENTRCRRGWYPRQGMGRVRAGGGCPE